MHRPLMVRLAIFDFDGTLADSAGWFAETLNAAAPRFGYRAVAPGELEALRRLDNRAILRRLGVPAWRLPAIARHFRAEAARGIDRIRLFPQALDSLAALAGRGVEIAIVSSNSEANVRAVLGADGAALVSRFSCGAALFGKAARLRRLVGLSGAAAAQAIAIGDETRDVEAARAAGILAGAVGWGYADRAALAAARPDFLFETFPALAATLGAPRRAA